MQRLLDARKGHIIALIIAAILGSTQFGRLRPEKFEAPLLHLTLCGLCGIVSLFLLGWLVRNFGRWFGAETEPVRVRTALGFGVLPWTILFAVLSLMLSYGLDPNLIAGEYFPILLGAFIYGFCILLLSLTVGLRIGIVKTFLCIVVTFLFGLFPLMLLMQVLVKYLS